MFEDIPGSLGRKLYMLSFNKNNKKEWINNRKGNEDISTGLMSGYHGKSGCHEEQHTDTKLCWKVCCYTYNINR